MGTLSNDIKIGVGCYQKVRNKRLDFQNHDKYTSN